MRSCRRFRGMSWAHRGTLCEREPTALATLAPMAEPGAIPSSAVEYSRSISMPSLWRNRVWVRIVALIGVLGVVPASALIAIGPRDQGFIEYWELLNSFQRFGTPWLSPLADPATQPWLLAQSVRPFSALHGSAASEFFANPFLGHFILLSVAVTLNGFGAFAVLRILQVSRVRAVAMACAAAWFAAWLGAYMPRTSSFQWGHVFMLGALVLMLGWVRGKVGPWALVIAPLLLASSVASYEAVIGTALLLGLLPFAVRAGMRRRLVASAIWIGATALLLCAVAVAVRLGAGGYEAAVVGAGPQWGALPDAIAMIYRDGMAGIVWPLWGVPSILAFGLAAVAVILALFASPVEGDDAATRQLPLLVIGAALFVLAPIAALVYIASPAHMLDAVRTFSAVGLPLAFGLALLWEWAGGSRTLTRVLSSVIVAVAAINLVGQREFTHDLSQYQSAVVELVSSAARGHSFVTVEDASGTLASSTVTNVMPGRVSPYPEYYLLPPSILAAAVSYAIGRPVGIAECSLVPNPYVLPMCTPRDKRISHLGATTVVLPAGLRAIAPGAG